MNLLCVVYSLGLADEVDLDLTGVFQLAYDLLGDLPGQQDHVVLGDVLGLDHDADFAAGLDGKGLVHTVEGRGQLFQLFQTADVVLYAPVCVRMTSDAAICRS